MSGLERFFAVASRQFLTVNFTAGSKAGSSTCTIYLDLEKIIICRGTGDTADLAARDAVRNWKTAETERLSRITELELALNGENHDKP